MDQSEEEESLNCWRTTLSRAHVSIQVYFSLSYFEEGLNDMVKKMDHIFSVSNIYQDKF